MKGTLGVCAHGTLSKRRPANLAKREWIMWVTIMGWFAPSVARLALKLAAEGFGRLQRWRDRRRKEDCPHVIFLDHERGVLVRSSTTPVSLFRQQCWQCGLVAPRAAFDYQLQVIGERVGRKTGFNWELVD